MKPITQNIKISALLALLVFSCSTISFAGGKSDKKASNPKKALKTADKMMEEGKTYNAIDLYEEVLSGEDNLEAAFKLADAYFFTRDYVNAEKNYRFVVDKDRFNAHKTARFHMAVMMKMNGKYKDAKKEFQTFKKKYRADDARVYKKRTDVEIEGCDIAIKMKKGNKNIIVEHPKGDMNTNYSDLAPVIWDKNRVLYSALRSDTVILFDDELKKNPSKHLKLYTATKSGNSYSNPKPFEAFKFEGQHITNGNLSPDGKRFYFNVCQETKKNGTVCAIYVSKKKGDKWSDPEKLPELINNPEYTSTQPTLGIYSGDREALYFVSNRPGGKGGMDLWYSTISRTGAFQTPKNMGSKVNTDRDEATPYYDSNTQTLYFSSNGKVGFGGYDVYSATGKLSRWSDVENIGKPINSSVDDMYYKVDETGKNGFIVSNRVGTKSVRSATCCDDIFTVQYKKVINVAVKGFVYDKANPTVALNDAQVDLLLNDNSDGEKATKIKQDSTLNDKPYFFRLNFDELYKVSAKKAGYLTSSVAFNTNGIQKSDTLEVDIFIEKIDKNKAYRLNNIYYDFDKWDLREASKKTLDTLYNILTDNPTIIIELSSHTDSRGSDSYNKELSQKRAQSCVNYLIESGISKERVTAKGYGETKHLDDCSQYDECPQSSKGDCPCHQLNRRTEFRIIGELDANLIYDDERYDETEEEEEEDEEDKKKSKK